MRRLFPAIRAWLQDPWIKIIVTPSDEVVQLREDLAAANAQIRQLRQELGILTGKFSMASEMNLVYMDLLNQHDIQHRHLREGDLWRK